MKKIKNAQEYVKSFMHRNHLSVRKLATLLGVNPTSVMNWTNERNEITAKNVELLEALERKVEVIAENDSLPQDQVLDILFALAKTALWKGIRSVPDSFRMEKGIALAVDLASAAKNDLDKIEKGLRIVEPPSEVGADFDIWCKDTSGRITLVEIKSGTLHETTFGGLVSKMAEIRKTVGDRFRVIVMAHDFTPAFVNAASQIASLKLKKFSIKSDIKTEDIV